MDQPRFSVAVVLLYTQLCLKTRSFSYDKLCAARNR
jgi:hypothetical protein